MSDLKMECPSCHSYTSSVGLAFRAGEPCPYCNAMDGGHEPEPAYVPICESCGRSIWFDDDSRAWKHE